MLRLIKHTIRPLPTELDKYKDIIQSIWNGPQVNTNKRRSSCPSGWVQVTAYWLSLPGFNTFTASQFYFSGKTFQYPLSCNKVRSIRHILQYVELGGNMALNRAANEQPVKHIHANTPWLTLLQRPAVSHSLFSILSSSDAIIDLLFRMQNARVSICTHAHMRAESIHQSHWWMW